MPKTPSTSNRVSYKDATHPKPQSAHRPIMTTWFIVEMDEMLKMELRILR